MRLVDRLLEYPAIYRLWQSPFAGQKFAPVLRHGDLARARRILDVGCGPGTNARYATNADYVGIDINESYLAYARTHFRGAFLAADLRSSDLRHLGRFDTIIVNSFLHHIDDEAVDHVLAQLRERLEPGGRVHLLELVLPPRLSAGRVMARLDRGAFARPIERWMRLFETFFSPAVVERYALGGGLWQMLYFQGRERG